MFDHTTYTRQFFRRLSPRYDLVVLPLRGIRKRVVALAADAPGKTVLDVACGTGEQSIAFANAGYNVTGLDLSPDMLGRARSKARKMPINFLEHDATQLPFADNSFDIVTISLAIHDMPEEMGLAVLREMKRVMKPDGQMIIMEHGEPCNTFGCFMHRRLLKHDTRYYPLFIKKGLQSYLDVAGLKMEHHETLFFGLFQLALCKK